MTRQNRAIQVSARSAVATALVWRHAPIIPAVLGTVGGAGLPYRRGQQTRGGGEVSPR